MRWTKRLSLLLIILLLLGGTMETAAAPMSAPVYAPVRVITAQELADGTAFIQAWLQRLFWPSAAPVTPAPAAAPTPAVRPAASAKTTPAPTLRPAAKPTPSTKPTPTAKPPRKPAAAPTPKAAVKPTPSSKPSPEPDGTASVSMDALQPTPQPTPPPRDETKTIALTFDDGPDATYTPQVLDVLEQYGVPATFFVLGCQIEGNEALLERMAGQGHQIGNHTYSHKQLNKLNDAGIRSQITQASDLIEESCGLRPDCLRPPYGDLNKRVKQIAKDEGLALVLWNIDPEDWRNRDALQTARHVVENAKPGAIILLHDIYPHAPQAAELIIAGLWQQGYTFCRVDELGGPMQPGKVYTRADTSTQR